MPTRKPSKRSLTARLDREWSQIVRARAGYCCERCGQPANQVHHVISRNYRRLRYDPRNLVSTCPRCHYFAHKCAPVYHEWFREERPDDWEFITKPESREPLPRSIRDLQDLLAETQAVSGELEAA